MAINLFSGGNYINSIQAAGKNAIINGGMDIWQRGTTSASLTTSQVYTADRWCAVSGATTAMTVSRQLTNDTTNLPFIQYCARIQRTSGQTGTSFVQFAQSFETVNSIPMAGKTVTLSFYARAGSNYSSTSNALNVLLLTGTGTDQGVLVGYTGSVSAINSSATLTTTWQRFSFTATLATNLTEIGLDIYYTPTGTAGANDYFEVTGVQLELGTTATTFSRAGGTIQGELAACQRYYWSVAEGINCPIPGTPVSQTSTQVSLFIGFPVTMRTSPTIDQTTGTSYYTYAPGGVAKTFSSWTLDVVSTRAGHIYNNGLSGLTAGQASYCYTSNASAKFSFSAEL